VTGNKAGRIEFFLKSPFMLRIGLLLAACCLAGSLFAQSELKVGVELFPNISHRRLVAQLNDVDPNETQRLENLEVSRFSYSAGLMAQWRNERIAFKTGAYFVESGYQTRRMEVDLRDDIPDGAEDQRTNYVHYFIEIPAELLFYQTLDDKNDFLFSMGISMAVNIANRERITYYTDDISEQVTEKPEGDNFSGLGYSFISGLGWEHHFDGFTTMIQPTFQFWLSGLLNDPLEQYNRNLYSVGVRTAVKF
jgi:hypothetical protein